MCSSGAPSTIFTHVEEVYGRLFNHHPVVSAEIKYFLKEFEELRNDREVERLFQLLERTTELRESHLLKACNNAEMYLSDLNDDFDAALSVCNRILESDERNKLAVEEKDGVDFLVKQRQAREKIWESFMADISDKKSKVDDTFRERERRLQEHFLEANDNVQAGGSVTL